MERPLDILQQVLPAETWDYLMVMAEQAHTGQIATREGMPEPIKVSGLGRPYPGTHVSDEDTNRAQRLRSPREVFTR